MIKDIICWWSGGVTSAVACKIASDLYVVGRCRFIMIDTHNEDDDTYRFLKDCQQWYEAEIEIIDNPEYQKIEEVWRKYKGLNFANGAICSSELKRKVRLTFEKENTFSHQIFGFDIDEPKRARALKLNYPTSKPVFPLLMYGLSKKECIDFIQNNGLTPPAAYSLGLRNNNCLKTGCVQGGIGYWQRLKEIKPDVFDKMAAMEHELTELRGSPVTMLKDQSKGGGLVFLKPHPQYPDIKDISQMKGRYPEPLMECNGFCGTNDLINKTPTEKQINLQFE